MSESYFMLKCIRKERRKQLQRNNRERDNHYEAKFKCRICLKEADISIFGESSFDLVAAIVSFAEVEVNEEDAYPKHLCTLCYNFLQQAVLFRQSAKETDKLLREIHDPIIKDDIDDLSNVSENFAPYSNTLLTYKCKLCKLDFNSIEELSNHKKSKHHKNIRIQCSICLGLLTPKSYKKHLVRHKSTSHMICEVCGKLYRKDNLLRHLQLHSYELPFQCQICPYRGRFMESLKIHMRTHTGDKPFSCEKCDLKFLTRSNLNRHLLTHKKERPYKCMECGRGFYVKRDLDIHFKADHAGLKDFNCRVCGNKYGTRKALMRHELRVHKRDKLAKGRLPLYLQAEYQK